MHGASSLYIAELVFDPFTQYKAMRDELQNA